MYFHLSDKTSLLGMEDDHKLMLKYLEIQLANAETEKELRFEKMHRNTLKKLQKMPSAMEKRYVDYEYICNELLQKLLIKSPKIRPINWSVKPIVSK